MEKIKDICDKNYYKNGQNSTVIKNDLAEIHFKIFVHSVLICLISVAYFWDYKDKVTHKLPWKKVCVPLIYMLSVVIVPLSIFLLSVFAIVRKIAHVYLKLKYGENYGGLLCRGDVVWAIEGSSRNIINTVLLIDAKDKTIDNIRENIINLMKKKFYDKNCLKITGIRQNEMGYTFLLKNQYGVDEGVSFFPDFIQITNTDEMEDVIGHYSNVPMPKNDRAMWHILITKQPLKWKGKDNFVLLLRVHHTVGDGSALLRTFLQCFSDDIPENTQIQQAKKTVSDYVKIFIEGFYIILMSFAFTINQNMINHDDASILHGKELSGEKITVWFVEENVDLVNAVKNVKKKLPNIRFSEVLVSAISYGVLGYFKKKSESVPQCATAIIPVTVSGKEATMENTFSFFLMKTPITINESEFRMLKRLEKVKYCTQSMRNSIDCQVNYWFLNVITSVLPEPVTRALLNLNKCTMGISNLPGSKKITIFNGCVLTDVIFWVPNRGRTGLGFSIFTYDNRFQLGLIVDKALISCKEEASSILNNMCEYIINLHKEVELME
ncbi:unnamed protein product [Brassicogethes aeneus]|uniref:O-acyltransferase WSD1 C-terminal domain-containing protein n=1 Tax=Brassicogethes aeneus TaxID=1431903 RepID=A0A9P0AMD4_BRAAE|nr:unnamed protein product [Brassicogethes aeneus]